MILREAKAASAVLLAAGAGLALAAGLGGLGLVYNDEFVYAGAARALAAGQEPWSFFVVPLFQARLGFPYAEMHAKGGIGPMALVFSLLGSSERFAAVPAMAAALLLALTVYAALRFAGARRGAAALVGALAGIHPAVATFGVTALPEAGHALGLVLGVTAVTARRSSLRAVLLAAGTFVGVAHRETALALPVAAGIGLVIRARVEGVPWRAALHAALAPVLAGFAAGAAAFFAFKGTMLDPVIRSWHVLLPVMEGGGTMYEVLDPDSPPITAAKVVHRVIKMLKPFLVGGDDLGGTFAIVIFAHASAVAALVVLLRARDGVARGLAAAALFLYTTKAGSTLVLHEPPGLFARHIGAEGFTCALAVAVALVRSKRVGLALALAALVAACSLACTATIARGHGVRLEAQRRLTRLLDTLVPPGDGAICSDLAWRYVWERPGHFLVLPPRDEHTLARLVAKLPIDRLVLDTYEPLVARPLVATGRAPRHLAGFELVRHDSSVGITVLVYERKRGS